MTGGRIKRIQPYIGNETFLMTYGDGVCDVNILDVVNFHKKHKKLATMTAVKRNEDKGVLVIGDDNIVSNFREKSNNDGVFINGGYMVLEPEIFDYIEGDSTVFEAEPLEKLCEEKQLLSYKHDGYWQCMDTKKENEMLQDLLNKNKAPWKVW